MICAQTLVAGVSVSRVARRDDVNANQIFNWLKDPRFMGGGSDEDAVRFCQLRLWLPRATRSNAAPRLAARSRSSLRVAIGCGSAEFMMPRRWPD